MFKSRRGEVALNGYHDASIHPEKESNKERKKKEKKTKKKNTHKKKTGNVQTSCSALRAEVHCTTTIEIVQFKMADKVQPLVYCALTVLYDYSCDSKLVKIEGKGNKTWSVEIK